MFQLELKNICGLQWRTYVFTLCLLIIFVIFYLNHILYQPPLVRPELSDIYDPGKKFLEYVRIKCRRLGIDYALTSQYCTVDTTVDNCQLNWTRILIELPRQMQLMRLHSDNGIHCMTAGIDKTCFDTNTIPQRVTLYKVRYNRTTHTYEDQVNSVYEAKMILAYSPTEMIIIEDHYDFCFLSLFDNTCLYYDY